MKKENKLIKAAMALSKKILRQVAWCSREFKKNYRKAFSWQERILLRGRISENDRKAMFFQFVFLFFYIVDKMAIEVLEPDEKNAFMSILWLELFETPLIEKKPAGMSEYREGLIDSYNDFRERYCNCNALYREVEEGLENTLLYKFSKDLTELTNRPHDIRGVMLCYSLASESLFQLEIKDVLKNIK